MKNLVLSLFCLGFISASAQYSSFEVIGHSICNSINKMGFQKEKLTYEDLEGLVSHEILQDFDRWKIDLQMVRDQGGRSSDLRSSLLADLTLNCLAWRMIMWETNVSWLTKREGERVCANQERAFQMAVNGLAGSDFSELEVEIADSLSSDSIELAFEHFTQMDEHLDDSARISPIGFMSYNLKQFELNFYLEPAQSNWERGLYCRDYCSLLLSYTFQGDRIILTDVRIESQDDCLSRGGFDSRSLPPPPPPPAR